MEDSYDALQSNFIEEMRKILPSVLSWWKNNAIGGPNSLEVGEPQNDFESRWPLGPVAHPWIIRVVRKYYIQTHELNQHYEAMREPDRKLIQESDWGVDDDEDDVEFRLPIDLLVNDLEQIAPDVYSIVSNLVFVPVGLSPDGEYC